ncbi:alginate O-acetyltransferase [Agaricicola taiwanensis]|uniref:Probable alginate O-acetylase AlgI n=1 Tax=Agaricicola taiwanensis TaxID=591372 RepID=A0A8J2VL46_9RHOB|nr:MBOAT family protein [Agaricicola taiwanensis]GGE35298.1 alginate O-acetyltransferase [Agaricicola taiwanensis]
MSYDTFYFAAFLAVTFCLFQLLPWKGWVLLVASAVFYSVAGLHDSLLAAAIILANYGFQFAVIQRKAFLWPVLAVNFGCLAYFKYRAFFAHAAGLDLFSGGIIIPLGISFYIFQLSAFVIDLAHGKAEPFRSLAKFTLFKLFFGQLVAGPIMRWSRFGPQIDRLFDKGRARPQLISLGLGLCVLGLFKKIILADSLAPIVDSIFSQGPSDPATAWLGAWLFGFQIYLDFSAYSEMALGLGFLFGLRLAINFRQPYLVRNPLQFWRHWHITLSRWIQDYLYIPLGGRSGSPLRQGAVLVLVMSLAGLWHGPNWTFIAWGLGWALLTVTWRFGGSLLARLGPFEWALTLALVMILWVFFRASDLREAVLFIATMFGGAPSGDYTLPSAYFDRLLILTGASGLLALHAGERWLFSAAQVRRMIRFDGPFLRALLLGLALLLVMVPKTAGNPFIYFRF